MRIRTWKAVLMSVLGGIVFINAQPAIRQYSIVKKIQLKGDEGWDYLASEDSTGRLFVSHGSMVQAVDENSGTLLGTIPDTKGVHGIALARELNKGFISNGKDSSVTVFNMVSLETIGKIPVTGKNPDAILYDEFSHQVFVFNGRSSNATVIDPFTDSVIATIALAGKPEFPASDSLGRVYVNIEDKSMVQVINAQTLKVDTAWSIAPGQEPSAMAIDRQNRLLFIGCANQLMVVLDAQSGKIAATAAIGKGVDGAAFDAGLKRAYSACGEGALTVIQEITRDSFAVMGNVPTQKGARTIALNAKTHHLFLPAAQFGEAPKPTAQSPHPRPAIKPGTFVILDIKP